MKSFKQYISESRFGNSWSGPRKPVTHSARRKPGHSTQHIGGGSHEKEPESINPGHAGNNERAGRASEHLKKAGVDHSHDSKLGTLNVHKDHFFKAKDTLSSHGYKENTHYKLHKGSTHHKFLIQRDPS